MDNGVTCSIFLEVVPFLHIWKKWPTEAEGLCFFPNHLVNASFPRQGFQLLGFPSL